MKRDGRIVPPVGLHEHRQRGAHRAADRVRVLATRTCAEWLEAFDAAGVPAGPVHTMGQALAHPQTLARGRVVDLEHPEAGATKALGCPLHFSATPASVARPAPLLGEHTREVLAEHGYADAEIDALIAAGVVAEPSPA